RQGVLQGNVGLRLLPILRVVGRPHPRRDVPVDAADVVARLVLADLLEVEAGAAEDAPVRPKERLVGEDACLDLDLLHHAEDLGWDRALGGDEIGHAQGTGTRSRTCAMTLSGVTSSASAS